MTHKRRIVIGRAQSDVPVADKGKVEAPTDSLFYNGAVALPGVGRRDGKDRKPGTPIPFHEPDPDRFAKAEILRQSILAREKARGGLGAYERKVNRQPEPGKRFFAESSQPSRPAPIEKPALDLQCAPEDACVKGERNGVVLYYTSATSAQIAMTGDRNANGGNIRSALTGLTETAYGWDWTQLKAAKRGPRALEMRMKLRTIK